MIKKINPIADIIETTYLDNLSHLSQNSKRHFLYRLFLSKRTDKNYYLLVKHGVKTTKLSLNQISKLNNSFDELVKEKKISIDELQPRYPHEKKRFSIWKINPELVLFYECLVESFYLYYFNIPFSIDEQIVKQLYDKLINSKEFSFYSSTQAICIMFYLDYIKMLPRTQEEKWNDLNSIMNCFSISKRSKITEIFNYLYALNHLIICSSFFYLRKPEQKAIFFAEQLEYWAVYYFDKLSVDLQVESLLSCYLSDYKPNKLEDLVNQRIVDNFNQELGLVDNKKEKTPTLESVEHTNALCLLIARINDLKAGMGMSRF